MELAVLRKHGASIRELARVTGHSRNTVRRYLRGGETIRAPFTEERMPADISAAEGFEVPLRPVRQSTHQRRRDGQGRAAVADRIGGSTLEMRPTARQGMQGNMPSFASWRRGT
jgi:transposase